MKMVWHDNPCQRFRDAFLLNTAKLVHHQAACQPVGKEGLAAMYD
jgi:hypothetical protein